ncbi:MAG: hypothetical protein AUH13_14765 [Acidobacteria bacterium 13_2_20CM_58_27]|nr:MAG: hypothetical protein AUH13_14765 [Acidobacteria bacterium 13_2_20CM_58_27]
MTGLDRLRAKPPIALFGELHKYRKWKSLLKGFFDTYGDRVHLIVTGSSRLDIFRQGSDSLMGRWTVSRLPHASVERGRKLAYEVAPCKNRNWRKSLN